MFRCLLEDLIKMYQLVIVAIILCFLFKVLNVNNSPAKSLFYCANAKFLEEILRNAPSLAEPYYPTRLWGFSGHIQTIIQGVLSRIHCPLVNGKRFFFIHPKDGTTVTYDLYQPLEKHKVGDYTLVVTPGICNSSESVYIRRVVYQAQFQGYRVAVLNHVGALRNVPVTGNRIFSYGNTSDLAGLVRDLGKRYPGSKFVCVGFSMGGNLVTKYLGEKGRKRKNVVAGISVCQGYDAVKGMEFLLKWEGFRRLYLFCITENMKQILRHWQKQLFPGDLKREKGIVERDVWSAATAVELDDAYTRKMEGFESVDDFYRNASSSNYFDGISVPYVAINAVDDPIVPPPLLEIVKAEAKKRDNFLYVEQKYGGHLGFYEGGIVYPNSATWLDKNVVNLADSLTAYCSSPKAEKAAKALEARELELGLLNSLSLSKQQAKEYLTSEDSHSEEDEDEETPAVSSEESSPLVIRKKKRSSSGSGPSFVCREKFVSKPPVAF